MRVAPSSVLAAAVFAVLGAAAADDALACYRQQVAAISGAARALAADASCGDAGSLAYCLGQELAQRAAEDSDPAAVHAAVASCYEGAGCTGAEAAIEAQWLLRACSGGGDGAAPSKRLRETAATAPVTAAAVHAAPLPTATGQMAADVDPVLRIQQRAATTTSSSTSLVCQTTTTVSTTVCPIQSTGPKAGKEQLSCYPTTDAYPTCAAGLMCTTDDLGLVSCMERHDSLDALGIVIAAVFAGAFVIGVASICFCCCRERRQHARDTKAAEAAAIARQAAIDRKRPAPAVRSASASSRTDAQPLMASGGGHDNSSMQTVPTIYTSDATADITGPNPFADRQQLR